MEHVMIIGLGQIGSSIERLYDDKYLISTVEREDKNVHSEHVDVMHICFGYSKEFEAESINYIKQYKPSLVIIESTVPIGTTRNIAKKVKSYIVHSPCMGKHPNLTESIRTFEKIIGEARKGSAELAAEHFIKIGVDYIIYKSSNESEAAKLLDTTYYGWNITFMRYVYDFCKKNKLEFKDVYSNTNKIYNEGYIQLNMEQFVRPVLSYMKGPIGGHCVTPNAKILYTKYKFKPAKIILDKDKEA